MKEQELLLYHSLKGLYLLNKEKKETVLHDLLGIQSQFSGYARMSLFLRCSDFKEETYGEQVSKIWSHRGTMHLVNDSDLMLHLSAADHMGPYVEGAWGLSIKECETWAPFLIREIESGNVFRDDLKKACQNAGMSEELLHKVFYGWGGLIREMVFRGLIVGTTGNQKEYRIPEHSNTKQYDRDSARLEMLRIYFTHYGPATVEDCKYFFGSWKIGEYRHLLDQVLSELLITEIGGKKYYHKEPLETEINIPSCILVPGFDQLVLGYKDRSRMIDNEHLRKLTNMAGIVFPSVIIRKRMRARWKMEKDTVIVTPFEHLYKKDEELIGRTVRKIFGRKTGIVFETQATDPA